MNTWRIVPAEAAHIAPIAANMREADRREVRASHGHEPAEALAVSLEHSDMAWTCLVDDEPAFMWGAARAGSLITLTGSPWLLATPAIYRVRNAFLRHSRPYVELMQARFPRLENHVHAANRLSLRWLAWCGFTVEETPILRNGEPFLFFWREAHV
ncbi:MAG: hypothetical protein K2J64_04645 [Desulfovibrio sp.]|nr:hypothetical protein [Desulfovibrio sp.]